LKEKRKREEQKKRKGGRVGKRERKRNDHQAVVP
jgi:hypothetical protein